jgi:hypothetical protein
MWLAVFDVLRVLSTHQPQIEHGEGAEATEIKMDFISRTILSVFSAPER